MLAAVLRKLPLEWCLEFAGRHRQLRRILFGKVVECQELPDSVQVAIREKGWGCSVALVTPDAKQYVLGTHYSKSEAEHLAQFLREWIEETER